MYRISMLPLVCVVLWGLPPANSNGATPGDSPGKTNSAPKHLSVMGVRLKVLSMQDYLRDPNRPAGSIGSCVPTYYVHAPGSLVGILPNGSGSTSAWLPVRILPIRPSDAPGGLGGTRGYSLVFERPIQHPHVTVLSTMWDWATPRREDFGNMERLYLSFHDLGGAVSDDDILKAHQRGRLPSEYVIVPADGQTLPKLSECILLNSDWTATTFCGNVRVIARATYSDLEKYSELPEKINNDWAVLNGIVAAKQFLTRPFPQPDMVRTPTPRLIEGFAVEQKEVLLGKEVPVKMSFSATALDVAELVRVSATNGGFRRAKDMIVYCPESAGKSILRIEAMGGVRHDGTMDYADMRELHLTVQEKEP